MDDKLWTRIDPLTGIIGSLLAFIGTGMFFSQAPMAGDPTSDFVKFMVDERSTILTGFMFFLVGAGLLVWWLVWLRDTLRTGDERTGRLANIAMIQGVVAFTIAFIGSAPVVATAWRGTEGLSAEQARLMVDLGNVTFTVVGAFPVGLFAIAASLAMARHPAFPNWLAWLGLVAGVVNGILVLGLSSRTGLFSPYSVLGLPGAVMMFAWVISTSVLMMRRQPQPV